MNVKKFIFSEKKSDRVRRHLLYWFCYCSYFTFFHNVGAGAAKLGFFTNVPYASLEAFSLFVPQVFFTYALISFVLPNYLLKNKYVLAVGWIILLLSATAVVIYTMLSYVNQAVFNDLLPEKYRLYNLRRVAGNI